MCDLGFIDMGENSKFCVFCGNKPENKTKEHIIPRWLIEKTGNVTRPMKGGPITSKGVRTYAFDKFVFPGGAVDGQPLCVHPTI